MVLNNFRKTEQRPKIQISVQLQAFFSKNLLTGYGVEIKGLIKSCEDVSGFFRTVKSKIRAHYRKG